MFGNAAKLAILLIITSYVVTGYPAKDTTKKCVHLNDKVEKEIDYVVDKLTDYLNTLEKELEEIDLTVINLEINQHRDDEREAAAILQLTVNNCPRKTIENDKEVVQGNTEVDEEEKENKTGVTGNNEKEVKNTEDLGGDLDDTKHGDIIEIPPSDKTGFSEIDDNENVYKDIDDPRTLTEDVDDDSQNTEDEFTADENNSEEEQVFDDNGDPYEVKYENSDKVDDNDEGQDLNDDNQEIPTEHGAFSTETTDEDDDRTDELDTDTEQVDDDNFNDDKVSNDDNESPTNKESDEDDTKIFHDADNRHATIKITDKDNAKNLYKADTHESRVENFNIEATNAPDANKVSRSSDDIRNNIQGDNSINGKTPNIQAQTQKDEIKHSHDDEWPKPLKDTNLRDAIRNNRQGDDRITGTTPSEQSTKELIENIDLDNPETNANHDTPKSSADVIDNSEKNIENSFEDINGNQGRKDVPKQKHFNQEKNPENDENRPQFNTELNDKPYSDPSEQTSSVTESQTKKDSKPIINQINNDEIPYETEPNKENSQIEKQIKIPESDNFEKHSNNAVNGEQNPILRDDKYLNTNNDPIVPNIVESTVDNNKNEQIPNKNNKQDSEKINANTKKDLLNNYKEKPASNIHENTQTDTANDKTKPELVYLHLSQESEKLFRKQGKEPVVLYMYDEDEKGMKKRISFVNE